MQADQQPLILLPLNLEFHRAAIHSILQADLKTNNNIFVSTWLQKCYRMEYKEMRVNMSGNLMADEDDIFLKKIVASEMRHGAFSRTLMENASQVNGKETLRLDKSRPKILRKNCRIFQKWIPGVL
ncbi:hypothetical protein TNIN_79421 [Trichonephila inaurata madagascariensis]|uniref:Uncharacterized protein n=1 Tax=Trichonephila inaurata madagascariensis TaxID=2747483 RepID=A0A8X7C232_9ARAC|nr:hypothetical protein TNIN_79421 [Trichonephila inaurata madagascariensis]